MLKKALKLRKNRSPQKDPKKENVFKGLASILEESGYDVRREPLKQGFGWKVASGSCQAAGNKIIFVERRLTQDDQNSFLIARIRDLQLAVKEESLTLFPEIIQKQLLATPAEM